MARDHCTSKMSSCLSNKSFSPYLGVPHTRLITRSFGAGAHTSLRVHPCLLEGRTGARRAAGAGEMTALHLRHVHTQVLKLRPQPGHRPLTLPLFGGAGHHCSALGAVNPGIDGVDDLLLPDLLGKAVDLLHSLILLLDVILVEAILLSLLLFCLQLLKLLQKQRKRGINIKTGSKGIAHKFYLSALLHVIRE